MPGAFGSRARPTVAVSTGQGSRACGCAGSREQLLSRQGSGNGWEMPMSAQTLLIALISQGHPGRPALAGEREAERATGKCLQPYKPTPLFIIFLSAIA